MILEWYHLCKRVKELTSMIARCKTEREQHLERLVGHLWRGQTQQALGYLRSTEVVRARNPEKLWALNTYLEKHSHEIIDYQRRRQQAGKTIGSGRIEKGVDQAIGCRQKKKGMSWSERGSKALGILRVVGHWYAWTAIAPNLYGWYGDWRAVAFSVVLPRTYAGWCLAGQQEARRAL